MLIGKLHVVKCTNIKCGMIIHTALFLMKFLRYFFTARLITVLIAFLQLSSVMVSTVRSWGCHLGGYVGGAYVGCVINGADDFL